MIRKDYLKLEFGQHKLSYLVLLIELILFIAFFMASWPNRFLQRLLILLIMIFYVLWGCVTHYKSEHLTKRIFWEYLGVSLLAGSILYLVTI